MDGKHKRDLSAVRRANSFGSLALEASSAVAEVRDTGSSLAATSGVDSQYLRALRTLKIGDTPPWSLNLLCEQDLDELLPILNAIVCVAVKRGRYVTVEIHEFEDLPDKEQING